MAKQVFSSHYERWGVNGFLGFGFEVGLVGGVADEEGHLAVDDDGYVEGGGGFGAGLEFGGGEVP